MKKYIGIDLGTTNSAICSFDGESLRLYKSAEQHDVTPSAIFIDKRGNKYVGAKAYNAAPRNPDNAAVLFKRMMGTSTPIPLSDANVTMSPEECSAEILRVLFGYLPEDIRNDPETGTVITVPAAFNQMQKDATMAATELSDIGKVALMQEPVAAAMAVMRHRKADGTFLVYDLGGGTLDIAIAQSTSGRVSLLANGGIAMCGGRDFDRMLFDNVVKPWLLENFDLPEDFVASPRFKTLVSVARWATEQAKIELSTKKDAVVALSESELGIRDLSGKEMYLDAPIRRSIFDGLIDGKLTESIQAARETIKKAGLSSHDIERVVFVGGPTHYEPMRTKVAFELGIAASTEVNPMTAVAEGAALFAESIDWNSHSRGRKSTRGAIAASGKLDLAFNYTSRTPDSRAKIAVKISGVPLAGAEFQLDSPDTGWSSGRMALKDGATADVPLSRPGENTFKVFVFDASGGSITLEQTRIVITRTAATIDAIPSSSSIGIEVLEKLGGRAILEYLVKEGDPLPAKGRKRLKATESIRAGGVGSINLNIYEGEIKDPVTDNLSVGTMSITGSHFEEGVIAAGAELVCDYEILDSGNVRLEISVPSIGATFPSKRNFYSRQAGQVDFTAAFKRIAEDVRTVSERIETVASKVDSPKLEQARSKLELAGSLRDDEKDRDVCKQAMDNVLDAKKLLAQVRTEHLAEMRQLDLDRIIEVFNDCIRQYSKPTETNSFDTLARTVQRSIEKKLSSFESELDDLRSKCFQILWRQDWFVIDRFKLLAGQAYLFPDQRKHQELIGVGQAALKADDIVKLRSVVAELSSTRIGSSAADDILSAANIVLA